MRTSKPSLRELLGGVRILSALLLLALLGFHHFALSAALPQQSAGKKVFASASADSVRFSSLGEVIQLRLEVIASQGEVLFDSGFTPGNVIDWRLLDKQSQRLTDGSYLCIITVKDSSGQSTKKRAIVSLLDQSIALRQSDNASLSASQADAAGSESGDDTTVTIVGPEASAMTAVVAHDGSAAHLVAGTGGLAISSGDFFANKLREHIRITAEGNVGVGVSIPKAKLDVDGQIRTSQGIVFPDGTIQTTAAKARDKSIISPGKISESYNQTSTAGKRGKHDKSFSPELFVGEDLTINGNIIFTPPSPQFTRDITMQNNNGGLRFFGAPTLTNTPAAAAIQFWGNNSPLPGQLYLDSGAHDSGAVIVRTTGTGGTIAERMRVTSTGNVGIGTMNPSRKLEIGGSALIYPATGPGQLTIRNRSNMDYSQVIFSDHQDTYRSYIGYIGANAGLGGRNDTVEFGTNFTDLTFRPNETELMRLTASGRVGIGTGSPSHKLEVVASTAASTQFAAVSARASGSAGTRFGVSGHAQVTVGTDAGYGLFGEANGAATSNYGVKGLASGATAINFGAFGSASGPALNIGVYGAASGGTNNWAGDFEGDTYVGGRLAIGTPSPVGNFHLNVPSSSSPISAMTIDVQSFQTPANAVASYYFRVRDIGSGAPPVFLIRGDGNVGIGTTAPSFKLQVIDGSNTGLRVQTDSAGGTVASFGSNGQFRIDAPGIVGGRLTVQEDSTVLINNPPSGTATDPATRLIVNGVIKAGYPSGAFAVALCHDPLQRIVECSSSVRYKENINHYLPGLNLIRRLRPVSFNWKQGGMPDMGLIAEEVAKVEPLLVTHNAKGEIEGVKYDRIAVVLLNAVKEQQAQIKQQTEQIRKQQSQLQNQGQLIKQQQTQLSGLKRLVCKSRRSSKVCK